MNKAVFFILLFITVTGNFITSGQDSNNTLSGKIIDKKTSEPLAGVTVYLPEMKTGTVTDINGNYIIKNLSAVSLLIQVSYISYRTIFETVDLTSTTTVNFEMVYTATEINNVVITGVSKATEQKRTPASITVVPKSVIVQNTSSNIIDALASQPGIDQITTGSGISKPVIRGMSHNRVVVVSDGIRQEGQQWGDEHGIEIDEYSVDHVEIIKGPVSLAYGSDAMAGVINILSSPVQPVNSHAGSITSEWQSNNGLLGIAGETNANRNGYILHLNYSRKIAHAYRNKYDGYVFNSGYRQNSMGFLSGLNKYWGYIHITGSIYNMNLGLAEGERDSTTGEFIRSFALDDTTEAFGIVPENKKKSYDPTVPYQKINHYKAVVNSNILIGKSSLKTIVGFQQNRRKEFGNVIEPDRYDLYFLLNTLNYDFRFVAPDIKEISMSAGFNGMYQKSVNKGEEYLVPDYKLFDAGIYLLARKSLGKFDISGGFRFDHRAIDGNDLYLNDEGEKVSVNEEGSSQKFAAFSSIFSGFSGSLGTTWQISDAFYAKVNASRGFRAPNIAELGSNGIHEGTLRYENGNTKLKPEQSSQLDFITGLNSEHISAELDLFVSGIKNYIFPHKLSAINGGDSINEGIPVFKYAAGNAQLHGGEIRIDVHPHPLDWIHFENTFSMVRAIQNNQPDSARYLPFIPSDRFQTSLKLTLKKLGKYIRDSYIKVELEHHFRQNRFYAAYWTETGTPGYSVINAGAGTDIYRNGKRICSIYLNAGNLTNTAFQSHLSRLKYAPVNYSTGRTGVYNMGRNIGVKLVLPINRNIPGGK